MARTHSALIISARRDYQDPARIRWEVRRSWWSLARGTQGKVLLSGMLEILPDGMDGDAVTREIALAILTSYEAVDNAP